MSSDPQTLGSKKDALGSRNMGERASSLLVTSHVSGESRPRSSVLSEVQASRHPEMVLGKFTTFK